jgi:hypothetical protein
MSLCLYEYHVLPLETLRDIPIEVDSVNSALQ